MTRAFLFALVSALPVSAASLRTLDDETHTGKIVRMSNEEIVMETKDGKITVPVKNVVLLKLDGSGDLTGKYANVELVDGTVLHCTEYEIKKSDVKLVLAGGRQLQVKLEIIGSILNEANELVNRNDWEARVLKNRTTRDLLALKRKGIVNAIPGTLGEADAEGKTIEFAVGGMNRQVEYKTAFGMVFIRPPDPKAKPVICRLLDKHQHRLFASSVVGTDKGFTVETPSGLKLDYAPDQLVTLDYSQGKVVFLSDMSYKKKSLDPLLTPGFGFDEPKRDTNINGDKLIQIDGRVFDRGLALRSPWELEFDLQGKYRELKMIAGLDDNVRGGSGPVLLKIFGDGKEVLKWTVSSGDKQRAQKIRLNIKDVLRLRIVVTRGETDDPFESTFDLGKHLALGDARVTK